MGISDLEAVLFSAAKPISIDVIQDIFKLSKQDSLTLIDHLASDLESHKRGIRVRISAAGVELVSAPESAMYIGHIRKKEDKLSNAAMETLAVIAYKQPITRQEIEEIRGVKCNSSIDTLLAKDFIAEAGRLDRIGKPIIYKTTLNFLNQFNLKSLKDLPDIEKFISDEEKNQIVEDENNVEIENENK